MPKKRKADLVFEKNKPWRHNENQIWLATTIELRRNIQKFNFSSKLNGQRQKQIVGFLEKEFLSLPSLESPEVYRAEKLDPVEKEYLVEHFLTTESFQGAHQGEAFVTDKTGEFLATINMKDHIHFHLLDVVGDIEGARNRLVRIETELGRSVAFAFSEKYGFLTADIMECGTGMIVNAFLQPAALIHTGQLEEVLKKYDDDAIVLTGLQGNPVELIGDLLVVRNNFTLGVNEESTLVSIRSFVTKFLMEESAARKRIQEEQNTDIKDRVSRAYAVLLHSYQIDASEALNALSLLKLGLSLGWLEGVSVDVINELFFNCRRGHLVRAVKPKQEIKTEEIPHHRSERIHDLLKGVRLTA